MSAGACVAVPNGPTTEVVRTEVGDAGLVTLALGVGISEGMIRAAVALGERPAGRRLRSGADRARPPRD